MSAPPPAQEVLSEAAVPRLANGTRLQYEPAQQSWVLLFPEGLVRLNDSAAEILRRCDGVRDIAALIEDLRASCGDPPGLGEDVLGFFAFARGRGWLELAC
ncbi:pyrroloquinoline quinone biosynthesis peptide chaperone PqqD [Caldimonas tepidiphila]|uniref:pyrroloquinoline quinone biosynthesis peptide chaperone PqqD n=1 Tax=Caldimonas tepidiphila TaxID=2315841 RepID=UPI000E5BC93A|nr:pyrroloquinoline quinone biosynthesis peptide chaperone PqqD [Caldimonas tepidiphila]